MTGYAAVTRELPQGLLQLELKTVNGRYLDMQFRLAEELRWCEPQLRELASGALSRGKLDCRLSFASAPLARSGRPWTAGCSSTWRDSPLKCAKPSRMLSRCACPTFCTGPARWASLWARPTTSGRRRSR